MSLTHYAHVQRNRGPPVVAITASKASVPTASDHNDPHDRLSILAAVDYALTVSRLEFFDEVRVRPSAKPQLDGLAGRLGAVLGVSGSSRLGMAYDVAVDGCADTIILTPTEIEPTGNRRNPADYSHGSAIPMILEAGVQDHHGRFS
jgi:hypothetical protein